MLFSLVMLMFSNKNCLKKLANLVGTRNVMCSIQPCRIGGLRRSESWSETGDEIEKIRRVEHIVSKKCIRK